MGYILTLIDCDPTVRGWWLQNIDNIKCKIIKKTKIISIQLCWTVVFIIIVGVGIMFLSVYNLIFFLNINVVTSLSLSIYIYIYTKNVDRFERLKSI